MKFKEFSDSCKWKTKGVSGYSVCEPNRNDPVLDGCCEINCGPFSIIKSVLNYTKSSPKWDDRFIKLAKFIGENWSKDPSTQVGAVIAKYNDFISLGYNGFPSGVPDDEGYLNDRSEKYPRVIHAEKNAILKAKRDLSGCTIYVYPLPPCPQCAAFIIQSGCRRVVSVISKDDSLRERWDDKVTLDMFKKAGVDLVLLEDDF